MREYQSQFNASAGGGGLSLSFNKQWGAVTFYEARKEAVYGIQIENGRPVAKPRYACDSDATKEASPDKEIDQGTHLCLARLPAPGKP